MTQYARPASDISNNTWTKSVGTTLYGCIDEDPYSDTDYIRATGATNQTCEVKLSSLTDPLSSANHIVRFRAKATGSGAGEKMTVTLYQGSTSIAAIITNSTIARTNYAEYNLTLSAAQADAITDYADLRIRFATTSFAAGETIDVSWAVMEVPDYAPTTHEGAATLNGTSEMIVAGTVPVTYLLPMWLTGFEHGVVSANGGGLFTGITGNVTSYATLYHAGAKCLRITGVASTSEATFSLTTGTPNIVAVRLYVRFLSIPGESQSLFSVSTVGSNFLYIRYDATSGCWAAQVESGTLVVSSVQIQTGQWYLIDVKFDISTGTHKIDWKIDGTAQTQATITRAASTFSNLHIGSPSNHTFDTLFDDLIVTNQGDRYPIGAGGIERLVPTSDGTHNAGTNVMEDQDGVDIGTATAYDLLADVFTEIMVYLRQVAIGASNYAEVNFGDTSQSNIQAAAAFLAYTSLNNTAATGAFIVIQEDASQVAVWGSPSSPADYSESTVFYKSKVLPKPAGGWDQAAINALKARLGYSSDATGTPFWENIEIEVAYAEGAVTHEGAAALAGTSILTVAGYVQHMVHEGAAVLGGTSELTVVATLTHAILEGTIALAGSSALTVAGDLVHATWEGQATLSGTSEMIVTAFGVSTHNGAAVLTGESSLTVAGTATHPVLEGATSLAGTSDLIVAGGVTHAVLEGVIALSGTSALTVAGSVSHAVLEGAGVLAGTSSLTVAGTAVHAVWEGAISLAGTSELIVDASGGAVQSGAAILSGDSIMTVVGTGAHAVWEGATIFLGTSELIVAGGVIHSVWEGEASLNGSSELICVGSVIQAFIIAEVVRFTATMSMQVSEIAVMNKAVQEVSILNKAVLSDAVLNKSVQEVSELNKIVSDVYSELERT